MKTHQAFTIIPAVFFASLWLSGCGKPAADQTRNVWHTNTVHQLTTNIVERWLTNNVVVEHTNTVLQTVTNEVVKEVPAQLSPQEKQNGTAGTKYLNAPALAQGAGALYKVGPLAAAVQIDPSATKTIADSSPTKATLETTLAAKGIALDPKGPQQLRLAISQSWATDRPRVALLNLNLELTETATLQRQADVVKSPASVWSTRSLALVREGFASSDLKEPVEQIVSRFCDEYTKAKQGQSAVEARLPAALPVFQQ